MGGGSRQVGRRFGARSGIVAVGVALWTLSALAAPAVANEPVPPTAAPPTTVAPYVPDLGPAPPSFRFDSDSGRQLLLDQRAAALAVLSARSELAGTEAVVPALVQERRIVAVRVELARARRDLALRALARHNRRLTAASVDMFVESSPAMESAETLGELAEADSIMDLSRAEELRAAQIEAVAAHRRELDDDLAGATNATREMERSLAEADDRLLAARDAVDTARERLADAEARVGELDAYEAEWLAAAARTAASPIMGPSALDVDDLVRKALDANPNPRLTVTIEELAAMFLEEGEAEGVRGDVAFAQSILETGAFSNPASGSKVVWTDNNFAGIGACDSCEHGRVFATAREGVRAQIQALRTYADPTVDSPDDYAHPMVLPQQLEWIRAGRTQVWYELTGKWATGAGYGLHIFDVYRPMHAMRTSPEPPAVVVEPPSASEAARTLARVRLDLLEVLLVTADPGTS